MAMLSQWEPGKIVTWKPDQNIFGGDGPLADIIWDYPRQDIFSRWNETEYQQWEHWSSAYVAHGQVNNTLPLHITRELVFSFARNGNMNTVTSVRLQEMPYLPEGPISRALARWFPGQHIYWELPKETPHRRVTDPPHTQTGYFDVLQRQQILETVKINSKNAGVTVDLAGRIIQRGMTFLERHTHLFPEYNCQVTVWHYNESLNKLAAVLVDDIGQPIPAYYRDAASQQLFRIA